MFQKTRLLKLTRRDFIKTSGTMLVGTLAAGSSVLKGLAPSTTWALELTTLSPSVGRILLKVARHIFPHEALDDAVYALVVKDLDEAAADDETLAGMWMIGEDMPQESNRISLHRDEKDQYGLPVPDVAFTDHPNDVAMREHAYERGSAVYVAGGAKTTHRVPPYPSTHNLGTCRLSARPEDGVANEFGQAHAIYLRRKPIYNRGLRESNSDHCRARHPAGGVYRTADARRGHLSQARVVRIVKIKHRGRG